MNRVIEGEFRRIRENLGRIIEVTRTDFERVEVFRGRLDELRDYQYVLLFEKMTGKDKVQRQIPFIGIGIGISLIRDEQQQVLYQNPHLIFHKPRQMYNPFFDKADNDEINSMRRAKFGEGHGFNLI